MWSVFFVFLSYVDGDFVRGDFPDAEQENMDMLSLPNGTVCCAKVSSAGENFLYQVSDGAEAVRSVVSPAGRLVSCSVVGNQMRVRSFMHECRFGLKEQRAGWRLDARFARMDGAKLMCQEFIENLERSAGMEKYDSDDSRLRVLKRSKRGFTYPGTLWCGAGNMADHYDQLGVFADTDRCCRAHDHCPHVIHAFSSNYGYTNFKWHSISHCDCDAALKGCLRRVNDTSSRVVGQAFFNVIDVPCFDLVYEEQCAERYWFGVCKQYEKFPIAMLREAIPYEFGGIDVIDELTLPSDMKTDPGKSEKEDAERTTQSTTSGPKEPSIGNVVTAAEDFIKVLATVSTSQSSTADSDKDETQSSEKKKRKNNSKKKKTGKKRKGKGKWRKRKQNTEAGNKMEEGDAVSTSGSKAEEASALSKFIRESHDQSRKTIDRVSDGGLEVRGKEEPSNEVMKDEPAMDKGTVSVTSPATVQKKPTQIALSTPTSTTTIGPQRGKTRRLGRGWKKKSKTIPPPPPPPPPSEELPKNTTYVFVPTIVTITPVAQPEQQSYWSDAEKLPGSSTASSPIVRLNVKRNRSKEREDREGWNKRRTDSSVSPIVTAPSENTSVNDLKAIPLTGGATVPSLSHRVDVGSRKTIVPVTPLNSSSVRNTQKLKERGLRGSWRKNILPFLSKNVLLVPPTPEPSDAWSSLATSRPAEAAETHSQWRLSTTTTVPPPLSPDRDRQRRRSRKKPKSAAVPQQSKPTSMTFTTTPPKVTSTGELSPWTSATSPIQVSIQRANAQFSRKKRRKSVLVQ